MSIDVMKNKNTTQDVDESQEDAVVMSQFISLIQQKETAVGRRLKQKEVADATKLRPHVVSELFNGKRDISLLNGRQLTRIAKFLGVKVEDLFTYEAESNSA